jgi:hypothetical protein
MSSAMLDAARARFADAGGTLVVWAVLREDLYETRTGDGRYLHLRGLALDAAAAERLAALPPAHALVRWHVRSYRLGLDGDRPCLLAPLPPGEELTIDDIVALLCEIPPGGTESRLNTGAGRREDGPLSPWPEISA